MEGRLVVLLHRRPRGRTLGRRPGPQDTGREGRRRHRRHPPPGHPRRLLADRTQNEAADYLTNKKPHLGYDHALKAGWPIATGIIEGACRHLVADRMVFSTGARWGLEGAEAVLTLRAMLANGDFNAYWTYHLEREHERVHHSRYRQDFTLTA